MKLISNLKDKNGSDIAINVEAIRAFYQPINNQTKLRETSIVAVDIGSPNILFIKKTFGEFKKLVEDSLKS